MWKYYLTELLEEGEFKSESNPGGTKPRLHKDLKPEDVPNLWEHLTMKFMPSSPTDTDHETRSLILKIMILLY